MGSPYSVPRDGWLYQFLGFICLDHWLKISFPSVVTPYLQRYVQVRDFLKSLATKFFSNECVRLPFQAKRCMILHRILDIRLSQCCINRVVLLPSDKAPSKKHLREHSRTWSSSPRQ